MVSVDFSQMVWNPSGVFIPAFDKVYRLSYIQLNPLEAETQDGFSMYELSLSRSREVLCNINVHISEMDSFKALQNSIFNSKLGV